MKTTVKNAALMAAIAIFAPAHAHVVLESPTAPVASSYKAVFKVGHGCASSPTRQIAVDIPAGMLGARPMPKPGWTLEIQRAPLAQPATLHGRTITEDVVRITWTAKTPEDMLSSKHYDEFVLLATTPAQAGILYWPVRQLCEQGSNLWIGIPQAGQKRSDLPAPAATLEILPQSTRAEHSH